MSNIAVIVLLLVALALPVVLFWLLVSRLRQNTLLAAAMAIGAGWAFNVAYVLAVQKIAPQDPSQTEGDMLGIATAFGWACPSVLVLLTWLVRRFVMRRKDSAASPTV